jgi:hypothetical protein
MRIAAALAVMLLATPALAEATLEGRIVTFRVLAYDDPARPLFDGRGATVEVGTGVEFGLYPEGLQNGLDVVPVQVNIGPTRIELSYPFAGTGKVIEAEFNGYELSFATDCVLFEGASVDTAATTAEITDTDLSYEAGTFRINFEGQSYGPDTRIAIDVDVADCPLS